MFLGYNTNGMAHHDLFDAVELLADIGYKGVAITIDHTALSPNARYSRQRNLRLQRLLKRRRMRSVIETGARFLLNPREKHEPTLISRDPAGRRRRIDFYKYAVNVAAELGSDCVSLWSGRLPPDVERGEAIAWLVDGLRQVGEYAARQQISIAFEPEPGMLIDTMTAWEELLAQAGTDDLRLTLDIGHLHCQGEGPIDAVLGRWAARLVNVHLEDMRAGVHEHLMFGEGQIDFPAVFRGLAQIGFAGGVHVELSRHSHEAPVAAKKAYDFLQTVLKKG
jgi:sugar phosphate isomerase/epimerase